MKQKGADPRPEDGHVDIANELVEQLCRVNLTARESRVLWFIFRKTYGWHKERDRISNSQFGKGTGLKRCHIWRTLKKLQARNMIIATPLGNSLEYSFQNDYTQWQPLPLGVTKESLPLRTKSLPHKVMKSLPPWVNTKEKKEITQKKGEDDYISLNTMGDGEDEDDGVATKITLEGGEVVSVEELWSRVLLELKSQATPQSYERYLEGTVGMGVVDGKTWCISVPSYHMQESIKILLPLIEKTVLDVTGLPLKVEASY